MSISLSPIARSVSLATTVAGLVLVAPASLRAQAGTGTIRGTVTAAESRAPIYGAHVAIENPPRSATTDDRGTYTLRALPAGNYALVVTAIGRQPMRESVTISP